MSDAEVSKLIADNLRGIPDFPKPGILFWDVTTLLLDPKVFQATTDAFTKRYKDQKIDIVAGALHGCVHWTACRQLCAQPEPTLSDTLDSHSTLADGNAAYHTLCSFSGFEARGLIFGAPLALALNCAFVPLRKPGKLPGETISEAYDLEYGSDKIEMHVGHVKEGQRVVLLDDLIATGGTMGAGIKLMGANPHPFIDGAATYQCPSRSFMRLQAC